MSSIRGVIAVHLYNGFVQRKHYKYSERSLSNSLSTFRPRHHRVLMVVTEQPCRRATSLRDMPFSLTITTVVRVGLDS